jgi:hypothetical protein
MRWRICYYYYYYYYYYTILDTPNWAFQDLITNMKFYIYKSI